MATLNEINAAAAQIDKNLNRRSLAAVRVEDDLLPLKTHVLSLLSQYESVETVNPVAPELVETALSEYGVQGKVMDIVNGPVVTQYRVALAPGTKISSVRNITEDLSVVLASKARIIAPIPGSSYIGIELPNTAREIVGFREVYEAYDGGMDLPTVIGKDVSGKPAFIDLAKTPHLLVAGQTGAGKSALLHSIFMSNWLSAMLNGELRIFNLIDPKKVEFQAYQDFPLVNVHSNMDRISDVFDILLEEMEGRYNDLQKCGARNIKAYREMGSPVGLFPYHIIIIDELADLIMTHGKELEAKIVRIAQLSRAVGMHMVLATQKPIVKVLTGLIKANVPARCALRTASNVDSRVILDASGAENLTGRGDMLYLGSDMQEPVRYHASWLSDEDIHTVGRWARAVKKMMEEKNGQD